MQKELRPQIVVGNEKNDGLSSFLKWAGMTSGKNAAIM
jgi:hypothetical protein